MAHDGAGVPKLRKLLLTGGTGFLGQHVLTQIEASNWRVMAASRNGSNPSHFGSATWRNMDLFDVDSLVEAMSGTDAVMHLAGVGSPASGATSLEDLFSINVVGTLNVLEASRQAGVRRVVVASSASVYGAVDSVNIQESIPLAPITPYGLSKQSQELACALYSRVHGLETVALRIFNVYGEGEDLSESKRKLIPSLLKRIRDGEPVVLFGDGRQTRDYVYVSDVARALIKALDAPVSGHIAINIGSGSGVSTYRVAQIVADALQVDLDIDWQPARAGEVQNSVARIDAASQLLDWEPRWEFEHGISQVTKRYYDAWNNA